MPGARELLSVAGQGIVTASQRIHIEGLTAPARKNLIRTAKDVLEGTLKVQSISYYNLRIMLTRALISNNLL